VRPAAYARTRNALDGAVTGLSPYITHGFVTLPEVLAGVAAATAGRAAQVRLRAGLARLLSAMCGSTAAMASCSRCTKARCPMRPTPRELPADIRTARTGVPVIDEAVRTLYATGTLHNHARMWLASYVVHLRKVHWRAGADWLYGHLLDGDLASNHLSWQWVAGTGSTSPTCSTPTTWRATHRRPGTARAA
jgi:deoxyribodipyrimidine photo-lyase